MEYVQKKKKNPEASLLFCKFLWEILFHTHYSNGHSHVDEPVMTDQQGLAYITSVSVV